MKDLNEHISIELLYGHRKRLMDQIFDSILTEAATGVKLSKSNNLSSVIDYLDKNLSGVKCIIPDSDDVRKSNKELEDWFCDINGDISNALFFLKSNGSLCMYEPKVTTMTDTELEKLSITRDGESYYIPGVRAKLQPTSKRLNSSNSTTKIWPESWDKYIVRGEFKVNGESKMPTTVIDFKKQGAYVIDKIDTIREDLFKSFSEKFGDNSVAAQLFSDGDFKKYISSLDKDGRSELSSIMANVVSEPLAIMALLENIDGVQDIVRQEVSKEHLGELYQIVIPIRQNWPVADFYAHFRKLPDRLVAISVKSNGPGNSSTIMGCLPVAEMDRISVSSKDADALTDFFKETIPSFGTGKDVALRISDSLYGRVQNLSMYTLYLLKEQCSDANTSNADRLVNTFSELIELVRDDTELYSQLKKICDLKGTNTIEKFLVCLLNANPATISIIRKAVADATSCFKITVTNRGNVTCIKQTEEGGTFRLKTKQGGLSLVLDIEDGKIVNVKKGHKTSQGQWIGFTFH